MSRYFNLPLLLLGASCLSLVSPLPAPRLLSSLRPGDHLASFLEFIMLGEVRQEERGRRRASSSNDQEDTEEDHDDGMAALAASLSEAAAAEPQQCVKRLVCDLATGQLGHQDDLLLQELQVMSSRRDTSTLGQPDFRGPITVGHVFRSISRCEVRFRCPFSGKELKALADSM